MWNKETIDERDYAIDWSKLIGHDTILTSEWSVTTLNGEPIDLVLGTDSIGAYWTTTFVSGGTHQVIYILSNTITTSGGRTLNRNAKLLCRFL